MSTEIRNELFILNKERLEQMAFRALQKGFAPDAFVTVCIDVDDPTWTEVVECLMPNQNWQEIRDRGEKPVARGTALAELSDYISEIAPDLKTSLTGPLPDGLVRTIIMAGTGASVYFITPTPQYKNN